MKIKSRKEKLVHGTHKSSLLFFERSFLFLWYSTSSMRLLHHLCAALSGGGGRDFVLSFLPSSLPPSVAISPPPSVVVSFFFLSLFPLCSSVTILPPLDHLALPSRPPLTSFHPLQSHHYRFYGDSQLGFLQARSVDLQSSTTPARHTRVFPILLATCRRLHRLVPASTHCHMVNMRLCVNLTHLRVELTCHRVHLELLPEALLLTSFCLILCYSHCSVGFFLAFFLLLFSMYCYFSCILQLFLLLFAACFCGLLSPRAMVFWSFCGDFCNRICGGSSLFSSPYIELW